MITVEFKTADKAVFFKVKECDTDLMHFTDTPTTHARLVKTSSDTHIESRKLPQSSDTCRDYMFHLYVNPKDMDKWFVYNAETESEAKLCVTYLTQGIETRNRNRMLETLLDQLGDTETRIVC